MEFVWSPGSLQGLIMDLPEIWEETSNETIDGPSSVGPHELAITDNMYKIVINRLDPNKERAYRLQPMV